MEPADRTVASPPPRWTDVVVTLVAVSAWLIVGGSPRLVEFDPPLMRAVLMGAGLLLGLPALLERPLRWDGWRGGARAAALVVASYVAVFVEMILVVQWHAAAMATSDLPTAGQAIPTWQEYTTMRLLAGLPWIAAIVLAATRGAVSVSGSDDHQPGPEPQSPIPAPGPASLPATPGPGETPDPPASMD